MTIQTMQAFHYTPNALASFLIQLKAYFVQAATQQRYHMSKPEVEEELRIIAQSQQNPKYFAAIYEKYYDTIFIYINKRIGHEEATSDVTARVFLKCLKNIKQFRYQGVPFSAWLFKIALNEINQFFRRQKKMERVVSLENQHVSQLISEVGPGPDVPEIDPNVLVAVLLETLDPHEIQYIELRFFDGRAFKEMAYMLGISESNAKAKTYRILKKMKKIAEQIQYN